LDLREGAVGENFTLDGVTEDDLCVGDIAQVGTAVVQVSGPRVPCSNQARRIGRTDWVKLTVRENRTEFYVGVLEEGLVRSGDVWELEEQLNPEGSIARMNLCMYLEFDPLYARSVMEMQGLVDW
jgi:MOSC domain-containing protein YiiM